MTLVASEIDALLQKAADMAADYLERNADRSEPVIRFRPPEELAQRFAARDPVVGHSVRRILIDRRALLEAGLHRLDLVRRTDQFALEA